MIVHMLRKAAAKMNDETLPLAKVEAERAAFEDKISVAKQRYQEVGLMDTLILRSYISGQDKRKLLHPS